MSAGHGQQNLRGDELPGVVGLTYQLRKSSCQPVGARTESLLQDLPGAAIHPQELDPGAEAKLLGDLIYDEVLKEQRKHRYSANGKDFPFNRLCDKHPHGNRAEGAIVVHAITTPAWPSIQARCSR